MQTTYAFTNSAKAFANREGDAFKLVESVNNKDFVATFISSFKTKNEIKLGEKLNFFLVKQETAPDGRVYAEFREVQNTGISVTDLLKSDDDESEDDDKPKKSRK